MSGVSRGDSEAFDRLVRPYLSMTYRTAVLIIHDCHAAQDAVQDALLEMSQSIARFDSHNSGHGSTELSSTGR
nr:sigma factor [Alicyclobacillus contaminans]